MGEINYFICDCCGVEDHWPRMPDGTPVKKGLGVRAAARWIHQRIKLNSEMVSHWTIELLHSLGRGDDAARKHGREAIWLCGDCTRVAEEAANSAALEVLLERGLPRHEDFIKPRVQDYRSIETEHQRIVTEHIAAKGFVSRKAIDDNPPEGMDFRDARHAVDELVENRKVRVIEVYVLQED